MEETDIWVLIMLFAWAIFPIAKTPASAEQCSFCLQYVIMSSNTCQEALLLKGKSVFALSLIICGHLPIQDEVSKEITSSSCQRFQAFKWWFRWNLCDHTEKSQICMASDNFQCWKGEFYSRMSESIHGDVLHAVTQDFTLWKYCTTHICYVALHIALEGWKHLPCLH